MNTEISYSDAKKKLSALLQKVRQGYRYTITLNGHPIADLVPSENAKYRNVSSAIESMRSMHKITGVCDNTLRMWKTEGHR